MTRFDLRMRLTNAVRALRGLPTTRLPGHTSAEFIRSMMDIPSTTGYRRDLQRELDEIERKGGVFGGVPEAPTSSAPVYDREQLLRELDGIIKHFRSPPEIDEDDAA